MKSLCKVVFLVLGVFVSLSVIGGKINNHKCMVQWNSWLGPQKVTNSILLDFNRKNYDISIKVVLGKSIKVNQKFLLLICRNGKLMYLNKKQIKNMKLLPTKKYIYCTVKKMSNVGLGIGILKLKITNSLLKNAIISALERKLPNSFNQALFAIPDNIDIEPGVVSFCLFNVVEAKMSGIKYVEGNDKLMPF